MQINDLHARLTNRRILSELPEASLDRVMGSVAAEAAASTRDNGDPIRHAFNSFVCNRVLP